MARLSVPPQKNAANTLRAEDEEESPATRHSGGVKEDDTSSSASSSTSENGCSSICAVAGSDACGTLRFEDPERQKSRKRGCTRRHRSMPADSDSRSVCDSPVAYNRPSRKYSPLSSIAGGCNSRTVTVDRNRRTCQRSSVRVGTSSSASCVTADTIEYDSQESSGESSSEDEVDEIDLRAKTEEELYRQGEHAEDTEEDKLSEDNECAVQASFGLFDPNERDEEAICRLLRQSALASSLRFSPCELLRVAAAVAQQGNVGSVLKTIDEDESEEKEEKRHKGQRCSSDSTGSCEGERRNGSRPGGSPSSATSTAAGRQQRTKSAGKSAQETEGREEERECGTVVGFLTLLSCKQYPDVVAPFKNAVLGLASKHASAEQRRTVERIFLTSVTEDQKEASKSESNTRGLDSRSACQNSSAELGESGHGTVNCGWLLKERLSNTPPQLIPRMYESLLEDISWSLSTGEMDEAERPFYAYTHVCGLTKVYKAGDVCDRSGKRHKGRNALPFDAVYPQPEDEILVEFSSLAFAWPTGLSVRITVEEDRMNASSADAATEYEQASLRPRFRGCPEYLLFYALPFRQFCRCRDAITVRAREGTVGCAAD